MSLYNPGPTSGGTMSPPQASHLHAEWGHTAVEGRAVATTVVVHVLDGLLARSVQYEGVRYQSQATPASHSVLVRRKKGVL